MNQKVWVTHCFDGRPVSLCGIWSTKELAEQQVQEMVDERNPRNANMRELYEMEYHVVKWAIDYE